MKKHLFAIFVIVALASSTAFASQNAGSAWNHYAAACGFDNYPAAAGATFRACYHGDNFDQDFNSILNKVSADVMSRNPGIVGDDELSISLENWPDAGSTPTQ